MNFTGMEQVLDDLAAANARIDARLDALDAELAPLSAAWTGAAADAYAVARARWAASARARNAMLASIRASTARVVGQHRAASATVQSVWGVGQ